MRMSWRDMRTGKERVPEGVPLVMDRAAVPVSGGRQEYAGDSAMLVSIRSYEDRVPEGAFISFDHGRRYGFRGLDQMLLMMEDIMDSVSVPRPSFEHKSFYGRPYRFQEAGPGERMPGMRRRPEDLPRLPQGKASFALRFHYRQHGSLQGEFIAEVKDAGMSGMDGTGTGSRGQEAGAGERCRVQAVPGRAGRAQRRVAFCSALELMRLVYEYLDGLD